MILLGRVALLLALTVSTVAAQSVDVSPTPEVYVRLFRCCCLQLVVYVDAGGAKKDEQHRERNG